MVDCRGSGHKGRVGGQVWAAAAGGGGGRRQEGRGRGGGLNWWLWGLGGCQLPAPTLTLMHLMPHTDCYRRCAPTVHPPSGAMVRYLSCNTSHVLARMWSPPSPTPPTLSSPTTPRCLCPSRHQRAPPVTRPVWAWCSWSMPPRQQQRRRAWRCTGASLGRRPLQRSSSARRRLQRSRQGSHSKGPLACLGRCKCRQCRMDCSPWPGWGRTEEAVCMRLPAVVAVAQLLWLQVLEAALL